MAAIGKDTPGCSLYVIPARDGRSAVVFRRGPSKRVLVLRWWLDHDRIEQGQWFAGRLYERHCDLSPDGDLLLYFAARYKGDPPMWTAISRTPYLTALVLWHCYMSGGGVFETDRSVCLEPTTSHEEPLLSHQRTLSPYPMEELSRHLTVRTAGDRDNMRAWECTDHGRMTRDGWRCIANGVVMKPNGWAQDRLDPTFVGPQVYERPNHGPTLRRIKCLQAGSVWKTSEAYAIVSREGAVVRDLAACMWADWAADGDLLLAHNGCLYRLPKRYVSNTVADALDNARLVADLRPLTFEGRPPPDWATHWP